MSARLRRERCGSLERHLRIRPVEAVAERPGFLCPCRPWYRRSSPERSPLRKSEAARVVEVFASCSLHGPDAAITNFPAKRWRETTVRKYRKRTAGNAVLLIQKRDVFCRKWRRE